MPKFGIPRGWIDADAKRVKRMDQHILTFRTGQRTCLDKKIAMLEIHKLVPALVMRYEIGRQSRRRSGGLEIRGLRSREVNLRENRGENRRLWRPEK
jgi:cytochrome P450